MDEDTDILTPLSRADSNITMSHKFDIISLEIRKRIKVEEILNVDIEEYADLIAGNMVYYLRKKVPSNAVEIYEPATWIDAIKKGLIMRFPRVEKYIHINYAPMGEGDYDIIYSDYNLPEIRACVGKEYYMPNYYRNE